MKYKKAVFLGVVLVCLGILAAGVGNTPEKRTVRWFHHHREALEDDILSSLETGRAVSSRSEVSVNYWDGEHPVMEYLVVGCGIAPASKYYGVFYSFDGEPVSFQNAGEPLTPGPEGEWTWSGAGDNHGMVRRLDANWFYFEAAL